MTYRASVEPSFGHGGVAIHLGQRTEEGFRVVKPIMMEYEIVQAGAASWPALTIDDGMAIELLKALGRHYDASYDTAHSREDYLQERKRVDKLIDHMMIWQTRGQ